MAKRRDPSPDFKVAFEAAFSFPKVISAKARDLRLDLEMPSMTLAGPMYNVLTSGNHDYVYRDKEGRFPGVTDAAAFRVWATSVAQSYRQIVDEFRCETPEEQRDRDVLLQKAEGMLKVIDAAEAEIQRARMEKPNVQ